jgi:hypothetical protein
VLGAVLGPSASVVLSTVFRSPFAYRPSVAGPTPGVDPVPIVRVRPKRLDREPVPTGAAPLATLNAQALVPVLRERLSRGLLGEGRSGARSRGHATPGVGSSRAPTSNCDPAQGSRENICHSKRWIPSRRRRTAGRLNWLEQPLNSSTEEQKGEAPLPGPLLGSPSSSRRELYFRRRNAPTGRCPTPALARPRLTMYPVATIAT